MKYSLTLVKKHESISELPSGAELGDFTLLTGLNGSGKTHLLQAIENGCIEVRADGVLIPAKEIQLFSWLSLEAGASVPADGSAMFARNIQLGKTYVNILNSAAIATALRSHLETSPTLLSDAEVLDLDRAGLSRLLGAHPVPELEVVWSKFDDARKTLRRNAVNKSARTQPQVAALLATAEAKYGCGRDEVTEDQFLAVVNSSGGAQEPFRQNLSEIFALYNKLFNVNLLQRSHNQQYGKDLSFLSDDAFRLEYGRPPWDFLNELLENEGFDFRVTQPDPISDEPFTARLIHQVQDVEIDFSALSSGERVLIALAICVYNTEDDRIKVNYPKLMLFDEVDAPLHPSMIRSLLQIFKEQLVEKNGIGVLLTTHSPTTVAVADCSDILRMNAESPRLEKVSSAASIQMLTEGVTTLSVKVESRRPVYVESNNDVRYFEELDRFLFREKASDFSPIYISPGFKTRGGQQILEGKSRVKAVVAELEKAGAEAFGLCDGDNEPPSGDSSIVLVGGGSRYAIENFLWDPLFIAGAALDGRWGDVLSRIDFDLADDDKFGNLSSSSNVKLQKVIDHVLALVGSPSSSADSAVRSIQLVGGRSVELPEWFVSERGHDWQQRVVKVIPQFRRYGDNEHQQTLKLLLGVVRYNVDLLDVTLLRSIESLHG